MTDSAAENFSSDGEPPAAERSLPEGTVCCADIMRLGTWSRMSGSDLRWRWEGDAQISLAELLGPAAAIQRFPSAHPQEAIFVFVCSDGGVISYQLQSGKWLHTLNTLSPLRYRIYELNLVPIAELGTLLQRTD